MKYASGKMSCKSEKDEENALVNYFSHCMTKLKVIATRYKVLRVKRGGGGGPPSQGE
jgi:hypothetical protein